MTKTKKKRGFIPFFILLIVLAALFAGVCLLWHQSHQTLYEARYPLDYEDYVIKYAKLYDVPPEMVYAIIKTESNFDPEATSHRDAYGLMQITKETFWWAQAKMGIEEDIDFYDPETNIRYGTYIYSLFYQEFVNERTALAAYNAGRGNVNNWLADPAYSADGVEIDVIPYEETRNYVDKVLASKQAYAKLYGERFAGKISS